MLNFSRFYPSSFRKLITLVLVFADPNSLLVQEALCFPGMHVFTALFVLTANIGRRIGNDEKQLGACAKQHRELRS